MQDYLKLLVILVVLFVISTVIIFAWARLKEFGY
jgi:hypothetical protein